MLDKIKDYLYRNRFLFFLIALLLALFGPVFFPEGVTVRFNLFIYLLFFMSGINLTRGNSFLFWTVSFLFMLVFSLMLFNFNIYFQDSEINSALLPLIFCIFTYSLFVQLLKAKEIDKGILMASFSALIVIGLIGARVYLFVEQLQPGSFSNLSANPRDDLAYFSFVTMFTIGYGDIVPLSAFARNVTVLFSLVGHFYSVVVMAIIIGKYLNVKNSDSKNSTE
jgi:voltage-gated potassium channel